jgi:Domain of unknown function (DUF6321)
MRVFELFEDDDLGEENKGLYYNVNQRKKKGISRPADHPKAPTAQAWKDAAKTAKKESVDEDQLNEDWKKVNRKDKTDGMSRKAVKAYRRENPGSKLQTAVTTKPSKLKKGSKSAKRRKSFCARMKGMKKAHAGAKTKRNPDSPINKALRRWNCESIEEMRNLIVYAEQVISEEKQRLDAKCWTGYKKQGTKMKGGVRVNNCVPANETALNPRDPKGDYDAKRKALHDLSLDKNVDQKEVQQRRLDLDKEAKAKGIIK